MTSVDIREPSSLDNSPDLTEAERQALDFARYYKALPPDQQTFVYFGGRLAGRSATEAFNRPLVPRSAGAAANGSTGEPSIFSEHAPGCIEKGFSPMPRFWKREGGHWRDIWPTGWPKLCEAPFTGEEDWLGWHYPQTHIALACGYRGLVAIDVDVSHKAILAAILDAVPHCRIARFGSKGFALLVRWTGDMESEEWFRLSTDVCVTGEDGKRGPAIVEIKGRGRNITIPPSLHQKTGQPYRWLNPETGEDIPAPALDDLPVVSSDDLRRLREALKPWAYVPPVYEKKDRDPNATEAGDKRYQACADKNLATYSAELAAMSGNGRNNRLFQLSCAIGWAVLHNYLSADDVIASYTAAMAQNGYLNKSERHGGPAGVRATIFKGLNKSRAMNDPKPNLPDRDKHKANGDARGNGFAGHPGDAGTGTGDDNVVNMDEARKKLAAAVERLAALPPDAYALLDMKAEATAVGVSDMRRLKKMVDEARKRAAKASAAAVEAVRSVTAAINADHAYIMSRGGKACVLHEGFDERGEPKEFYYSVHDFHNNMANRVVLVEGEPTPQSKIWLSHPQRRQYQSIVFDPSTTEREVRGHYNLWHGFGVEPKRGSWSLMRQHIRNVLALADEETDAYIHDWLAFGVQNPEKQAEAALAFRGPRGSGKGALGRSFTRMYGRHGLHVSSGKLLTGRFSAHLEKCAGLFADEAFASGDKADESQLQRVITEPTIIIEGKGKDAFEAPNRLKIMMASNEDWVAPVGPRERRYAVSDVSHARVGDKPYFVNLFHEMGNGGISAMLYDLLEADITGFHPRWSIPQTEALREQARHSLPPELKWLLSLLQDGALPVSDRPKHPERTALANLVESARKFADRKKPILNSDVTELLVKWGVKPRHTKTGNVWEFPPLAEVRARFDKEYGKQDWPLTDEEEDLRKRLPFTPLPPRKWA